MPSHVVGVRVVGCEPSLVTVLVRGCSERDRAGVDSQSGTQAEDFLPACEPTCVVFLDVMLNWFVSWKLVPAAVVALVPTPEIWLSEFCVLEFFVLGHEIHTLTDRILVSAMPFPNPKFDARRHCFAAGASDRRCTAAL